MPTWPLKSFGNRSTKNPTKLIPHHKNLDMNTNNTFCYLIYIYIYNSQQTNMWIPSYVFLWPSASHFPLHFADIQYHNIMPRYKSCHTLGHTYNHDNWPSGPCAPCSGRAVSIAATWPKHADPRVFTRATFLC